MHIYFCTRINCLQIYKCLFMGLKGSKKFVKHGLQINRTHDKEHKCINPTEITNKCLNILFIIKVYTKLIEAVEKVLSFLK